MTFTVGETVGAYRIVEQLGQGGMATVFKAFHAALDRYVAIKVLHPAFKEDPNFLARFQREARVVARLEHPNIVPVYDFAEHDGAPYLVMKFVEGETLKARLARAPVPVQEMLRLVEAVGAGLDYAHQQGILHRDIKPSNIMLARDGSVYLADFGLARIALAGESTLSTDSMLGTPHYMSPEQAKGVKDLDAGTDIYSFGVVVYELVAGRVPYSADTPFAIIHDHIFAPLPMPRTVNPNVPEAVERVLLKALAKERGDRFADVPALTTALREALAPFQSAQDMGAGVLPEVMAPPRPEPVSPYAETPAARTRAAPAQTTASARAQTTASAPAQTTAAPTETVVAPAPAAGKFEFKWWHALVVVGAVVVCGVLTLTIVRAQRLRRDRPARETPVAQLVAPTVGVAAAVTDTAPPAETTATVADTLAPPTRPPDPQTFLAEAENGFRSGRPDDALQILDQAVALYPGNTMILLRAGDLALAHGYALRGLVHYYVPGARLEGQSPDDLAPLMFGHTALAYYVSAADPEAAGFLQQPREVHPDSVAVTLALLRYDIFHNRGQAAGQQLEAHLHENPENAPAHLIFGDYYLGRGENAQAARHYARALEAQPAGLVVPPWVRIEARCNLNKIKTEQAGARLEATCADRLSLLTGR